ncbi:MAG: DUF4837 family protein [Cytophagales bacterium]|nr:DUF4837 family protein [Cytophagales bacterium]
MTFARYLLFSLIAAFLFSCDLEKAAKLKGNLPRANGQPGQIIVVMDSAQWKGGVGKEIRSVFQEQVYYLPRQEAYFSLSHIDPMDFQSIFKKQKNIIFVTVLNDKSKGNRKLKTYFTKESLDMIEQDPSLFMYPKKDEFAKGQEVLHLFGEMEAVLMQNIKNNKEKLKKHFLDIEGRRCYNSLYAANAEKGISRHIKEKLNCEIQVPFGFEIALEGDDFVWLRNFSPDVDKSVYISWVDYTSKELFSLDSLLALRTEVSKPYILYKPEDKQSYLLTETDNFDVFKKEINFKDHYAVELRGLWKVNKYYMGGPFVSYSMVDENTNRLYYVEAFLYSPGKAQRDHMRELETIIKTFDIVEPPA